MDLHSVNGHEDTVDVSNSNDGNEPVAADPPSGVHPWPVAGTADVSGSNDGNEPAASDPPSGVHPWPVASTADVSNSIDGNDPAEADPPSGVHPWPFASTADVSNSIDGNDPAEADPPSGVHPWPVASTADVSNSIDGNDPAEADPPSGVHPWPVASTADVSNSIDGNDPAEADPPSGVHPWPVASTADVSNFIDGNDPAEADPPSGVHPWPVASTADVSNSIDGNDPAEADPPSGVHPWPFASTADVSNSIDGNDPAEADPPSGVHPWPVASTAEVLIRADSWGSHSNELSGAPDASESVPRTTPPLAHGSSEAKFTQMHIMTPVTKSNGNRRRISLAELQMLKTATQNHPGITRAASTEPPLSRPPRTTPPSAHGSSESRFTNMNIMTPVIKSNGNRRRISLAELQMVKTATQNHPGITRAASTEPPLSRPAGRRASVAGGPEHQTNQRRPSQNPKTRKQSMQELSPSRRQSVISQRASSRRASTANFDNSELILPDEKRRSSSINFRSTSGKSQYFSRKDSMSVSKSARRGSSGDSTGESNSKKSHQAASSNSYRIVPFGGNAVPNKGFSDNRMFTAKYTLWTLVPLHLMEQFRRIANVYFLLVSLIQVTTDYSSTSKYGTVIPLITVLTLSLIREWIEDQKRQVADMEANNTPVEVLADEQWMETVWSKVVVGDIIKVSEGEAVPADVLLISSTDDECYVNTSNINGSSELSLRRPIANTSNMTYPDELASLKGTLTIAAPKNEFFGLEGVIYFDVSGARVRFAAENTLLRGSTMYGSQFVCGLVAYTGAETKMGKSFGSPPFKYSRMEGNVSRMVAVLLGGVLLGASFISAIFEIVMRHQGIPWYLPSHTEISSEIFQSWILFVILYNNLVPISLYVTMEIVSTFQGHLIQSDDAMYDEATKQGALARNTVLNTQLGQINYVVTDKTGTLTNKDLRLRYCCVGNTIYGVDESRRHSVAFISHRGDASSKRLVVSPKSALIRTLLQAREGHTHSSLQSTASDFMLAMTTCNTVLTRRKHRAIDAGDDTMDVGGEAQRGLIEYLTLSADDRALVEGSSVYGHVLRVSTRYLRVVSEFGNDVSYKVLQVLPFDSDRKCMSVVLETPSGRRCLLTKGAASSMMKRMQRTPNLHSIAAQVQVMSRSGFRVIVFAVSEISEEMYPSWCQRYAYAVNVSSVSRRSAALAKCAEEIEKDMIVLGAVGFEDQLQRDVVNTISSLHEANIKCWMCTGDEMESAVEVAWTSSILQRGTKLLKIATTNRRRIRSLLTVYCSKYLEDSGGNQHHLKKIALAVDSAAMTFILNDAECKAKFAKLSLICVSVIVVRSTPKLKARVVSLIKETVKPTPITLSIGDGANDVSMLQAADVAVGVRGKETMEAIRSSDYSINEFRHLSRLILVHGHQSYYRMSTVILYSFYKNIANVFVLFFYSMESMFSATSVYPSMLSTGWNIAFTGVPIILFGFFEQSLNPEWLQRFPSLYRQSQKNSSMSIMSLFSWVSDAISHSAIVFLVVRVGFGGTLTPRGHETDLWELGTLLHGCLVLIVNMKLALHSSYITGYNAVSILLCILMWFVAVIATSLGTPIATIGLAQHLFNNTRFWLTILLVPVLGLLMDVVSRYIRSIYFPNVLGVLREAQILNIDWGLPSVDDEGCITNVSDLTRSLPMSGNVSMSSNDTASQLEDGKVPNANHAGAEKAMVQPTMNPLTLSFQGDPAMETLFRERLAKASVVTTRRALLVITVLTCIYTIYSLVLGDEHIIIRALGTLAAVLLMPTLYFDWFVTHSADIVPTLMLTLSLAKNLTITQSGELGTCLFPILIFLVVRPRFHVAVSICLFDWVVFNIYVKSLMNDDNNEIFSKKTDSDLLWFDLIYVVVSLFPAAVGYMLERSTRTSFLAIHELERHVRRNQTIVNNMLPPNVSRQLRLLKENEVLAQCEPCVTILFASLMDFEEVIATTHPATLVSNLDVLYSTLDELCEEYCVQKFETVGNVYMACAGIDNGDPRQALAVTELAVEMLDVSASHKFTEMFPGGLKIGVHTGVAYVGVISKTRPTFSLFGDTVNTASRMCSNSLKGKVTMSVDTYSIVNSEYTWDLRSVEVKGKGLMTVYTIDHRVGSGAVDIFLDNIMYKRHDQQAENMELETNIGAEGLEESMENKRWKMQLRQRFVEKKMETCFQNEQNDIVQARLPRVMALMWLFVVFDLFFVMPTKSTLALLHCLWVILASCLGIAVRHLKGHEIPRSRLEIAFAVIVLGELMFLGQDLLHLEDDTKIGPPTFMLLAIVANSGILLFQETVLLLLLLIAVWLVYAVIEGSLEVTMFVLACGVMNATSSYALEMLSRHNMVLRDRVRNAQSRSEDMLYQLLPAHVANQLRQGVYGVAKEMKDVTILYSDVVGFTKYSASSQPHEVVKLLSNLFSLFDELVSRLKLFKVQTIGDAYVVVGGMEDEVGNAEDGAERTVLMAAEMLAGIAMVRASQGYRMQMRIGIHTGKIVAGVIGTHRLRFDIWGQDAFIANKLESSSDHRRVLVSEVTRDVLRSKPGFEFVKHNVVIHANDRRHLNTYLLSKAPGVSDSIVTGQLSEQEERVLWPPVDGDLAQIQIVVREDEANTIAEASVEEEDTENASEKE